MTLRASSAGRLRATCRWGVRLAILVLVLVPVVGCGAVVDAAGGTPVPAAGVLPATQHDHVNHPVCEQVLAPAVPPARPPADPDPAHACPGVRAVPEVVTPPTHSRTDVTSRGAVRPATGGRLLLAIGVSRR